MVMNWFTALIGNAVVLSVMAQLVVNFWKVTMHIVYEDGKMIVTAETMEDKIKLYRCVIGKERANVDKVWLCSVLALYSFLILMISVAL